MIRPRIGAIAILLLFAAAATAHAQNQPFPPAPPSPPSPSSSTPGVHLGVASCSGSNCHGGEKPVRGSPIQNNEYRIWKTKDKHSQAYAALQTPQAIRMAKALGLPDAVHAPLCLNCHADNAPSDRRGPYFALDDGVGCEACHGGASAWLGSHISNASHRENIERGLYPTENPIKRAERCLSCHFGDPNDPNRFVNHRIYGAGHPRLAFELDTFTAIQPAHFVVTPEYVKRKGRITNLQVWATGQAVSLVFRMDALLAPRNAPQGLWPEFAVFDCQSCHHNYDPVRGERRTTTGLPPGTVKLDDANAVMLEVAASRFAPAAARSLKEHMLALHKATVDDWPAAQREARAVREAAMSLRNAFAERDFSGADMRALADALFALGLSGSDEQFSHAEQITMSLQAIIAGLKSAEDIGPQQGEAVARAMNAVTAAFSDKDVLNYDAWVRALKELQRTMRR